MAVNDDLARTTSKYLESMENFCNRNFGTTDLPTCRMKLERAYEKVW